MTEHLTKPGDRPVRLARAALCLLLAFSLTLFMMPAPWTGGASAFANEPTVPAPPPATDEPSEDPAANPSTEPTTDPATEPAANPAAKPTPDPAPGPAADPAPDPSPDKGNTPASPNSSPAALASGGPSVRGPADFLLDKVYGAAFGLAETIVFKALSEAADPEDDEQLNKVLDFMDGLMGGSASLEHECDQILQAVNDLSSQLDELQGDIDQQFNGLEKTVTLNQIENQRSEIIKMSDSVYAPVFIAYREFIDATKAYSEAYGTANEAARRTTAETKERALVNAFNQLSYDADLATIETNGINMGDYANHRYLYNLDQYADEAFAFDHQRFALLTAGINDVVSNLNVIAYVQRLEYDYWKAKADNAPGDIALRNKALDLENKLEANLNRIVKDVNYTVSEFANKDGVASWPRTDLLTLMRPYDFETPYRFDYQASSNASFKYYGDHFSSQVNTWRYTAIADKTKPVMNTYRAGVDGNMFLVVDGKVGLEYGYKVNDVIHGMRYWEKVRLGLGLGALNAYVGFPDQDFYNLRSTADGVYRMPKDLTPLLPILNVKSYQNSGGSLTNHLKKNGMRNLGLETYLIADSYDEPTSASGVPAHGFFTSFHWYKTTIPTSGKYDKAKVTLSTRDTTPNAYLLAVLAQDANAREAYPLHVLTEGSGLTITATDLAGNPLPERVPSGTCVKLSVQASDPVALDSLVLKDLDGNVLETIASADAATIVEGSQGASTFLMTMPYQETSLVGTPGQAGPNPLHFSQDADGAYLVSSLDDLVKVSTAFEQHPILYADATFRLANDLENTRRPAPAWTTPIGSEAHPFTGTFDGAGFGIGGFTMDMEAAGALATAPYGGLFGVIGDGGCVRNLSVYGVDFRGSPASQVVGALAGANRGLIENCSTGTPQTSYQAPASGIITSEELRLLNATVSGKHAGGLVGENHGDIVNCWSGADVTASEPNGGAAGGLVGLSASGSTVWNSYALGSVRGGAIAGGLIGTNDGDVFNAYAGCIGKVSGAVAGTFIGANNRDASSCYTFEGAGFGQQPVGTGSAGGVAEVAPEVMKSQAFADTLNEQVAGVMHYWAFRADANAGRPYLVADPLIERTVIDEATGVQVSGIIHAGARLFIEPLADGDASHSALSQHAKDAGLLGSIVSSYRASLHVVGRKSGQVARDGDVTLRVPVAGTLAGRAITVVQEHPEGIDAHAAEIVDGLATAQVDAVAPFAVVAGDAKGGPGGGKVLAPTGDGTAAWPAALGAPLAAAVGAVVLSFRRLRRLPECLPKRK